MYHFAGNHRIVNIVNLAMHGRRLLRWHNVTHDWMQLALCQKIHEALHIQPEFPHVKTMEIVLLFLTRI